VQRIRRDRHPTSTKFEEAAVLRKLRPRLLLLAVALAGPVLADSDPTVTQVYEMAQSGHIEEAQKMMKQVLRDHPESAKAHNVMAELYATRGEFTQAREQLDVAEQLGPGLPFAGHDSVRALRAVLARELNPQAGARSSVKQTYIHWGTALLQ
jgi:protein involved in temperature-dependent protein secretion